MFVHVCYGNRIGSRIRDGEKRVSELARTTSKPGSDRDLGYNAGAPANTISAIQMLPCVRYDCQARLLKALRGSNTSWSFSTAILAAFIILGGG
jgi:hypothetical protein